MIRSMHRAEQPVSMYFNKLPLAVGSNTQQTFLIFKTLEIISHFQNIRIHFSCNGIPHLSAATAKYAVCSFFILFNHPHYVVPCSCVFRLEITLIGQFTALVIGESTIFYTPHFKQALRGGSRGGGGGCKGCK